MHTVRRRDRSPGQLDPVNLKSLGLNLFLCSYWNSPVLWVNDVKDQKSCQKEKKETRKKDLILYEKTKQCTPPVLEHYFGNILRLPNCLQQGDCQTHSLSQLLRGVPCVPAHRRHIKLLRHTDPQGFGHSKTDLLCARRSTAKPTIQTCPQHCRVLVFIPSFSQMVKTPA